MVTIMRKTIQLHVRKLIIKKSLLLLLIAFILAVFCHFSCTNEKVIARGGSQLVYILGSIILSLAILSFIAYKIRLFHNIFARGWIGTVIKAEMSQINNPKNIRSKDSIHGINLFIVVSKLW